MGASWLKSSLLLAVLAAAVCAHCASADELVKFATAPYVVGRLQQYPPREHNQTPSATTRTIDGYLSKPGGSSPFPAVVYLHGCGGLHPVARKRFSDLFTSWGYVFLAVDSFATRGIKKACAHPMPERQADAWGALLYLSKLPFVDRRRIAVVGESQGGIIAMLLASMRDAKLFGVPDGLNFKAAVAFYPRCSAVPAQLAIPTIILTGQLDDWEPPKICERWMRLRNGRGAPVKLVVYPGAYHAFDSPGLGNGKRVNGHWLKYDPEATRKSMSRVREFLAAQFSK
ncbi:MAG: dienelactone hydrolase family protein [Bradyrhizobium sp.]